MTTGPIRLVLFDIDGTLLITKGATSRCILRACRELFGEQFEWGPITVGTLDPQIFADLCRHNGITDPRAHLERYHACYTDILAQELAEKRDDVIVLPGIAELLASLKSRSVTLGIVTGNYRRAVELKLAAAGLDAAMFDVIASAEDAMDRPGLVRVAMQRTSVTDSRAVVVIGDTPRDVDCAHAHTCRAIGVATGRYSTEQLRDAGADRVVADFTGPEAVNTILAWTDEQDGTAVQR